jgi:hypothetical protein
MSSPFKGFPQATRQPVGPMAPPPVALDRFQNVIQKGHLVLYCNDIDLVFEVVDVQPSMDPTQQGQMRVMLRAEFPIMVNRAQPTGRFSVCGMTQAMQQQMAAAARNGGPIPEGPEGEAPPGPSLVLTDAPEITPTDYLAKCDQCGDVTRISINAEGKSKTCADCGVGTYQAVQ